MEENTEFQSKIPDIPQENKNVIELTPTVREDFTVSVKWGKFFAIAGIAMSALMFIFAITMFFGGSVSVNDEETLSPIIAMAGIGTGIMYLIMAIVYCIMSVILLKAVNNFKTALTIGGQDKFAVGFHHLKTFITIVGILIIISIVVVLFSFIGLALLGAAVGA